MTLSIKEISWGVGPRGYSTRVTADVTYPCVVGPLPEFRAGRRCFSIDEVGVDYIILSVIYANHPTANKSWTLYRGERGGYFPRSFDGGYRYEFMVE